MPRNQYFGTKMPLAQQALEMLRPTREMKARQHSGCELCCRLSVEARRYGKASIEALASHVLIRSQNDEIESLRFSPLGISLGRRTSAADGGLELKWRRNNVEQIYFGPIISREDQ